MFGIAVEYTLNSPETLNRIRECTASCKVIQHAVRRNSKSYELKDGIYYFKGPEDRLLPFIPSDLYTDIVRMFHSSYLGGHTGVRKTVTRLQQHVYFPRMYAIVEKFVASCPSCQMHKSRNSK